MFKNLSNGQKWFVLLAGAVMTSDILICVDNGIKYLDRRNGGINKEELAKIIAAQDKRIFDLEQAMKGGNNNDESLI